MEAKKWWFVDVSPFPRGYFQVPCLFSGVYRVNRLVGVAGVTQQHVTSGKIGKMFMVDQAENLKLTQWKEGKQLYQGTRTGVPLTYVYYHGI